ncbi:MAG: glycosyltransferase family 1 protein [Proteobacteria bacterium]|nr:glycosyltransferase family 1 protein [Pseudomonadota bacterium]
MKILYLGDDDSHGSSRQRARALERLGHQVRHINPLHAARPSRVLGKLHHLTGYTLAARSVTRRVLEQLREEPFDLAWVDGGAAVSRELVLALRQRCGRVVNYNLDDPTGKRDGNLWRTFKQALPAYDLCVVVRDESAHQYRQLGARQVIQVYRGYDEVAHATGPDAAADEARWRAGVVFVGTWMPERGAFMAQLLRAGLPLVIYGNRWEKAPEWSELRSAVRGPGVLGPDYVKAIRYAQISLGLVSRGNRDLHTQRSAEIPFIGGLLCAERTREHLAMYRDGTEAVFWQDAKECVAKCRFLLDQPERRTVIAQAGQRRVRALGLGNEPMLARILQQLETAGSPRPAEREMSCN